VLVLFNHLDFRKFKRLSDQNLKNGFDLGIEIEKIRILAVIQDSAFIVARAVWNENCSWRPVDKKVRLYLSLVYHIFVVTQVFEVGLMGYRFLFPLVLDVAVVRSLALTSH